MPDITIKVVGHDHPLVAKIKHTMARAGIAKWGTRIVGVMAVGVMAVLCLFLLNFVRTHLFSSNAFILGFILINELLCFGHFLSDLHFSFDVLI